eukprot:5975460-Prymnesium_polylepis.1
MIRWTTHALTWSMLPLRLSLAATNGLSSSPETIARGTKTKTAPATIVSPNPRAAKRPPPSGEPSIEPAERVATNVP